MGSECRRRPTDREIIVVGIVCMLLSAGFCLALSIGLGRGPAERMEKLRQEMSLMSIPESIPGVFTGQDASAKPAHMNLLLAELRRAEMELRMRRGISMIVSMAAGMGMFLVFRALRAAPVGPVLVGGKA